MTIRSQDMKFTKPLIVHMGQFTHKTMPFNYEQMSILVCTKDKPTTVKNYLYNIDHQRYSQFNLFPTNMFPINSKESTRHYIAVSLSFGRDIIKDFAKEIRAARDAYWKAIDSNSGHRWTGVLV